VRVLGGCAGLESARPALLLPPPRASCGTFEQPGTPLTTPGRPYRCSRRKGIAEEALTLFMAYASSKLVSARLAAQAIRVDGGQIMCLGACASSSPQAVS
jgi:hypothetical protein